MPSGLCLKLRGLLCMLVYFPSPIATGYSTVFWQDTIDMLVRAVPSRRWMIYLVPAGDARLDLQEPLVSYPHIYLLDGARVPSDWLWTTRCFRTIWHFSPAVSEAECCVLIGGSLLGYICFWVLHRRRLVSEQF